MRREEQTLERQQTDDPQVVGREREREREKKREKEREKEREVT
jgi:hypothetical protein